MQLGIFTKDTKTGELSGNVKTLNDNVERVAIKPVAGKRKDGSPDYRVYGPNGSDFGAGWNKIAKEGGKPYISLVLQDPSFNNGQPLYPILAEGEANQFVLAWEAPDPAKAGAAPKRPAATPSETSTSTPAPGKRAASL